MLTERTECGKEQISEVYGWSSQYKCTPLLKFNSSIPITLGSDRNLPNYGGTPGPTPPSPTGSPLIVIHSGVLVGLNVKLESWELDMPGVKFKWTID